MLVVVLNMPEHSSFQDMLFPMLFISKYAKSYASMMDISLSKNHTRFQQNKPKNVPTILHSSSIASRHYGFVLI